MNTDFAFQIGVKRGEWMSSKNGRFLYAAQTHLSQDTEIRTALRASVLAHYVLSLARASDNSCELSELENALRNCFGMRGGNAAWPKSKIGEVFVQV